MLNRYLAAKQSEKRGPKQLRPYLASECNDLNEADRWRQQILRDVGKKVMEIQNAGLGEHRWVAGGRRRGGKAGRGRWGGGGGPAVRCTALPGMHGGCTRSVQQSSDVRVPHPVL